MSKRKGLSQALKRKLKSGIEAVSVLHNWCKKDKDDKFREARKICLDNGRRVASQNTLHFAFSEIFNNEYSQVQAAIDAANETV